MKGSRKRRPPVCPCGSVERVIVWRGLCRNCFRKSVRRRASPPAPKPPRPLCRHCGHRLVCRPLGLCWTCYHTAGVRELYGWRPREVNHAPKLPPRPTTAVPGTEAKIRVMRRRAEDGFMVCHPADAREPGDTLPADWLARNGGAS